MREKMRNLHTICDRIGKGYGLDLDLVIDHKRAEPKAYNKEAVLGKLKTLSEIDSEYEDERILWWAHEKNPLENYHGIYLVGPVMLALLLEEYEIAEKLIDRGYDANDLLLEEQVYVEIDRYDRVNHIPLYLSQLLMTGYEMPTSLYEKLCEKQIVGSFSYISDYWQNPFLVSWDEWQERKTFPSMEGFQKISNFKPELLSSMLDSLEEIRIERLHDWDIKEWKRMILKLTEYFRGFPEDILELNACMIRFHGLRHGQFDPDVQVKEYACWIQMLPRFMQACEGDVESQKQMISSVLYQYRVIQKNVLLKEHPRKHLLKYIRTFLDEYCLKWYSLEDLLEELPRMADWMDFADILQNWKTCMNQPICFYEHADSMIELLMQILGTYAYLLSPKGYEYDSDLPGRRELRIKEALRCIEVMEPDSWKRNAENGSEGISEELIGVLFSAILKSQSEELLLAFIEKGVVTEKEIPVLSKAAYVFGGEKFLPLLMVHRDKKEWEDAYVYDRKSQRSC